MSSYAHQCKHVHPIVGYYEISWMVKGRGRRTRIADKAQAVRFCKKWGIPMPEEKTR